MRSSKWLDKMSQWIFPKSIAMAGLVGLNCLAFGCLFVMQGFAASQSKTFRNPILRGSYPDPSICRVGNNYYMVNSTFEYFPGVPIFHSKDLVHWKQIGHVLTHKEQLNLDHVKNMNGVWAPTLRYHDGMFYMITTNVTGGGNFFVTAKNPAGPWSDPIWIDKNGFDPSFFFDDDGTVYYTRHEGREDGSIVQSKIDLKTGKLDGEPKEIWRGTGGAWPEGPHIFKVRGKYYLLIAEGGTEYGHMVTIARSDSPWGPYESNPRNPILTHRDRTDHPFQALGHADMVETPTGWWMVCLGIRPQGGKFHHLGRETFLAPVTWSEDGWPVVNGTGKLELELPVPDLTEEIWEQPPRIDYFDNGSLGLQWNYVRNPYEKDYSLTERPGYLRLKGSAITLNDVDSPAFIGRRQTDLECKATTRLSFEPKHENEEAGIVVRGNDMNHFELGITLRNGKRQAFFREILHGKSVEPVKYVEIGPGDVILKIEATATNYQFFCKTDHEPWMTLGAALTKDISSEKIGAFTGVYIGLYATGNGQASAVPADFDWFEYAPSGRYL